MIDFAYYFQHCSWDNPCFQMGMFWMTIFVITGAITLYYKIEDAKAEAEQVKAASADKKASEANAQTAATVEEGKTQQTSAPGASPTAKEETGEDKVASEAGAGASSKRGENNVKADIREAISEQEEESDKKQ